MRRHFCAWRILSVMGAALPACGDSSVGTRSDGGAQDAGGGSGGSAVGSGGAGAGAGAGGAGAGGSGAGGSGTGGGGAGGAAGGGGAGALDPPVGQYGRRADLPAANSEMAVAEAGGKIYVVGGYPSSRVIQTTVQVYDPATNAWTLTTSYPFPIHHPVVAGVDGKLYSLGGQIAMSGTVDTNRTLVLDPATAMWRELTAMPTARGAGAVAVIGDQIYVVGGRPPAGNAFEVYDVSDDRWTALPDLPPAYPERNHIAVAAIAGKIYVAGGRYNGGSFTDPRTDSLDVFDPVAGSWSLGARMLRPRGGVNGVAAYGCFHVWGGEGSGIGEPNDVYPDHDVYSPAANAWTALPRLPTPIHGVTGAAFVNGLIYMPGGGTTSGGSSGSLIFQVFRPDPAAPCI